MKVLMAGATDRGVAREHNEDSVITLPDSGLAVLADGMGGHQAGEVASRLATDVVVRELADYFANPDDVDTEPLEGRSRYIRRLIQAIQTSNAEIIAAASERSEYRGMGATIVAALFFDNRFSVAHLGDSRMYGFRNGYFEQLTEDHSLVQEFVRQGLLTTHEARYALNKNLITQALGIEQCVDPTITEGMLQPGDLYLLCSDGLTDVVTDDDIRDVLRRTGTNLDDAVRELIDMANSAGGPDNISVILVRVLELSEL